MSKAIATLVIGALVVAGLPRPSQAGDDGWYALAGFLGGVIVGSARDHHTTVVHHDVYVDRGPRGHYEYVTRKVWVPGYWEHERGRCGRRIKVWHEGYYRTEREKVWVPYRPRHGYSYHRHHRYHHRGRDYCRR